MSGDKITKIINLQKSQFNNSFYINYGYILNSIPLESLMMHIYNRVTSFNIEERNRISFLLNLESDISDAERIKELKEMLQSNRVTMIVGNDNSLPHAQIVKSVTHYPNIGKGGYYNIRTLDPANYNLSYPTYQPNKVTSIYSIWR